MNKNKLVYRCNDCGHRQTKWAGQCPGCGRWNSMVEELDVSPLPSHQRFAGYAGAAGQNAPVALAAVRAETLRRTPTGSSELDRVLGGGLVEGSAVLLGGDPGIGKSTLLLQAMVAMSQQLPVLYVTGEESIQQVSLRAARLQLPGETLQILAETALENLLAVLQTLQPKVLVVDSIQTVYTELLQSAPGSVAQVRECAAQLVRHAKRQGMSVLLIGHVTKDGALAGPRVLEHMVDTVLYFEGEAGSRYRVVRAIKNRFGAANELGVFAMLEDGLHEVKNPSAIFLSRHDSDVAGSVVLVTREGSRPLLVEVQALVDESHLANPRRVVLGMEANRLAMLLAVLHRHGGVAMFNQDVFINVVGGMRLTETAGDLAMLCAVLSSYHNRPIPRNWVIFGEVGLAGEVRPVPHGEERLREAAKQGFQRAIIPKGNAPRHTIRGLECVAVSRLSEALAEI